MFRTKTKPAQSKDAGSKDAKSTGDATSADRAPRLDTPMTKTAGEHPYLQVRDLAVHFPTDDGLVKSVDGLSFDLARGKTLGIVGESGSGKSVTSMTIMGLNQRTNATISGEVLLDGEDLVKATPERVRQHRGRDMAMIFQDPLSAMHPFYTVGFQLMEAYTLHNKVSKADARKHAIEMLGRVGIPKPAACGCLPS